MSKRSVLYLGDSIMGQDPSEGYAALLGKWVYDQDSTSRHHFLHVGRDSSQEILDRMENEIKARHNGGIRTILVSAGIVDSGFYEDERVKSSFQKYAKNMVEIIEVAKRWTDKVLVPGLTRIDSEIEQPRSKGGIIYSNERISEFDSILKEACDYHVVPYIRISNTLSPEDLQDGIHPNRGGHQKIFELIKESYMESLLRRVT